MTDPNETNEEVNEELSTDELKGVSCGLGSKHVKHIDALGLKDSSV